MSFYLNLASVLVTLVACFVVLCRIDKMMAGVTRPTVFVQHAALGLGLFCAAILQFLDEGALALVCASGGVVVFFGLSAGRWRQGAPDGTSKPMELGPGQLHNVHGGLKAKE